MFVFSDIRAKNGGARLDEVVTAQVINAKRHPLILCEFGLVRQCGRQRSIRDISALDEVSETSIDKTNPLEAKCTRWGLLGHAGTRGVA